MKNWSFRPQLSTGTLARASARHPWTVIAAWLVLVGVAVFFAASLDDVLRNEMDSSTESGRAAELIAGRLRDAPEAIEEFVIVESTSVAPSADEFVRFVAALAGEIRRTQGVTSVVSYLDGAPGMTSDGAALVAVALEGDPIHAHSYVEPLLATIARYDGTDGFRVTSAGNGSIDYEFTKLAEETLVRGELIGIGLAVVVLVLVFGAVVAAGLPILLAVLSIAGALGVTALVGRLVPLSTFVTSIITMIGLAVGIDYTLLIVQRFREELGAGRDRVEAIARAGETASRAVLFSGIAVAIALTGMLGAPVSLFRALGVGSIIVVVVSVVAALTLLPALLGLLGHRVNWLTLPLIGRRSGGGGRFWDRTTRVVTARPVLSVVVTAALLLGASSWVSAMELGSNWVASLPDDSPSRHAFDVLIRDFGGDIVAADIVIEAADVTTPSVTRAIGALRDRLALDAIFGTAEFEVNPAGDLALLRVAVLADASSSEAREAVRRLRETYLPDAFSSVPATVTVGGGPAGILDDVQQMTGYMPIVLVLVLSASFVLLMLVFRSIVVPAKAVVMNLLSVGAAYGLVVLVFQQGVGARWLGFQQVEAIESWIPLFLFCMLFGLSMDYHVFLLSRIKERYEASGDNRHSVAYGLRSTGSIITGAALIMVAVFGGFATSEMALFQQMGFGLAVAVILDATVVRSVLVPASMELLGDWNWYFPNWLRWLPQVSIEGQTSPSSQRLSLRGSSGAREKAATTGGSNAGEAVWIPGSPDLVSRNEAAQRSSHLQAANEIGGGQ